jgi:hypothetical protein
MFLKYTPYRVLSIDPGSTRFGVCKSLIYHSGETGLVPKLEVISSETLKLERIRNYNGLDPDLYADRKFRIMQIDKYLEDNLHDIDIVVYESPFFYSKKPQAFAVLTEVINSIEVGVYRHKPNIPICPIEPTLIKKTIGVKKFSDKESVREAVTILSKESKDLTCTLQLDQLDEHGVDAIAIGMAYFRHYELFDRLGICIA